MACLNSFYNFCIYRGEDKQLLLSFSDDVGNIVTLDKSKFIMVLNTHYAKNPVVTLTSDNRDITLGRLVDNNFITNDNNATVLRIQIPHSVTEELPSDDVTYVLFKVDLENYREVLLTGNITVHKGLI